MAVYKVGKGSKALIVAHDIFGPDSGRQKLICDRLAGELGATVLLPAFFDGGVGAGRQSAANLESMPLTLPSAPAHLEVATGEACSLLRENGAYFCRSPDMLFPPKGSSALGMPLRILATLWRAPSLIGASSWVPLCVCYPPYLSISI